MKLLLLIKSTIRREKLYCRERWREGGQRPQEYKIQCHRLTHSTGRTGNSWMVFHSYGNATTVKKGLQIIDFYMALMVCKQGEIFTVPPADT